MCIDELLPLNVRIINLSLESATVPRDFKCAYVRPLIKSIEECTANISTWMKYNMLRLNNENLRYLFSSKYNFRWVEGITVRYCRLFYNHSKVEFEKYWSPL